MTLDDSLADEASLLSDGGLGRHPERHRPPVRQREQALQRVADGMPVVQNPPQVRLALVGRDDGDLDAYVPRHDVFEHLGVAREDSVSLALEVLEKTRVADHGVLDDLGQPGPQFLVREGGERGDIAENGRGLMERADEVFAFGVVHGRLAADGGVHLPQERGGDGNPPDAAHERRCDEPAEVRHHAAAEGHQNAPPVQARAQADVVEFAGLGEGFGAFALAGQAGRDDRRRRLQARGAQTRKRRLQIPVGDVTVRQEDRPGRLGGRFRFPARLRKEPRSDPDGVGGSGEAALDALHRTPFSPCAGCTRTQ